MIKVKEEHIVFLIVSSFVGMSPGAVHYYGRLEHLQDGEDFDVIHKLTQIEADRLNKKWFSKDMSLFAGYQKGEDSSRFVSSEAVIVAAKEQFKIYFPKAAVLILGTATVCAPFEVLVGPKEFKEKMTKLAKRYDKLNWDRVADREEIDEILDSWQELWPIKYTSFGS